jgi:hypothetical protein
MPARGREGAVIGAMLPIANVRIGQRHRKELGDIESLARSIDKGPAPGLIREAFKTSRLADFASQKELVTQTGHPVKDWPLVVIKEATDNAIDTCEDAGLAPVINISIDAAAGEFVITDNGPGIPSEIVDGLVDYSVRVSTCEAYVSPSRGRQGNALQTLLAMAFALDGARGETLIEMAFALDGARGETLIEARGTELRRNGGGR